MHASIICPRCNSIAVKTNTKYGVRNDCCGMWSWGNYPLTDALTHKARKKAHEVFDPLWKEGHFTRTEAYDMLSEYLSIPTKKCHMKLMDKKTAKKVPEAVNFIRSVMK